MKTKKVVINRCYGGFGLSEKAYEKLIEYGIPLRKYVEQKRGKNGLYLPESSNDGEVILTGGISHSKYWDTWIKENREHSLLLRVIEELGTEANGPYAALEIVEIPVDVPYEIDEYDGMEHVAEVHRTW